MNRNNWQIVLYILVIVLCSVTARSAFAVTDVNPRGVNVRASGPTTIFLTFQNLNPGQQAAESFWCGELIGFDPVAFKNGGNVFTPNNPCVAGTIFGRLPARHNLSRTSGVSNVTDIMTIPASVARRAYQKALRGGRSEFFYVRRFVGGGADEFVAVSCRMSAGGARTPLALMDVRVFFRGDKGTRPIYIVPRGKAPPPLAATIHYNGTGRLKGRWEVVMPGDPEPAREDLLTEASLPIELRALQRRYTLVQRFDIFLPPSGRVTLPGPDPSKMPHNAEGRYKVLLRIEATDDREGDSNTLAGIVNSGGVAGFPMPVLRYHVGTPEARAAETEELEVAKLSLMSPVSDAVITGDRPINFSWLVARDASFYRLEVTSQQGPVLSAVVGAGVSNYFAPPWIHDQIGESLRWRITALDTDGGIVGRSPWRLFQIAK